jgi:hypothetical protein
MAWTRIFTLRILRLHVALISCTIAFVWLADWQVRRALGGNTLSWAYAFEWPIFIVYAFVLWRRLLLDELHRDSITTSTLRPPRLGLFADRRKAREQTRDERQIQEDIDRDRYNSYLSSLADNDSERGS